MAFHDTFLQALIIRNNEMVPDLFETDAFLTTPIFDGYGYIYVPRDLIESYKTATNWSYFADQFRILEDYTDDGTITGVFIPPEEEKTEKECGIMLLSSNEMILGTTITFMSNMTWGEYMGSSYNNGVFMKDIHYQVCINSSWLERVAEEQGLDINADETYYVLCLNEDESISIAKLDTPIDQFDIGMVLIATLAESGIE